MARTIFGIAVIVGVGLGSYWLGTRQPKKEAIDTSLIIPESSLKFSGEEEASDPIMRRMIENHFQPLSDWKKGE
jgi:hypothetical protein